MLFSSDSEGEGIKQIRISDRGSKPQHAKVQVQGVPAEGVIDSGADITIIGGDLFRRVAAVAKLKKRDFKKADKIPRTYSQRPFTLDGRMDLDISFEGSTMRTPIYIKMDAPEPLLLSEGVCRQLGVLSYHPAVLGGLGVSPDPTTEVKVRGEEADSGDVKKKAAGQCEQGDPALSNVTTPLTEQSNPRSDGNTTEDTVDRPGRAVPQGLESTAATVPLIRVRLLQSVKLLPRQSIPVVVKLDGGSYGDPLLVEHDRAVEEAVGLQVEDSLLAPSREGVAQLVVTNPTGFTQVAQEGEELGQATKVSVVVPEENLKRVQVLTIRDDCYQRKNDQLRRRKIRDLLRGVAIAEPEKSELLKFLEDHNKAFSLEDGERGETDLVELEIDTGDARPKKQCMRRMPFAVREEVSRQLKTMQETGVIQPSNSPWGSPVVMVRKKDGSHCFCIDYRELNSVTCQDSFPLPRIDDLLDQLGQSHYFSTLDLASGYWQIHVHPESIPKTAFITPQGSFEFRVMPFGLTNAPLVFQRLMQRVLSGLNPEESCDFVSVYIDDILIFSQNLRDHLKHLKLVIDRLQRAGLKLKPSKCHFLRQEVDYLGHMITRHGLKTNPRLVLAVSEFPTPRSVRETRQFLGLSSYYRRFIPMFSRVAQPLHSLTKKGAQFEWNVDCQRAFEELKSHLTHTPVLCYPSFEKDFVLETDASSQGIGAVLSQRQEDGQLHPVAYASRSLSPAEKDYSITELETLAVVWSISHFHTYLYGHSVVIHTDHSAVRAVLESPNPSAKHARWWTKVYGSGIRNLKIVY